MKKIYYDAGIRIRDLREKKHFTREQLAEKADISSKFLYEIEVGNRGFSAITLYKLAEALNTNTDYILYGKKKNSMDNEVMNVIGRFEKEQVKSLIEMMELIYQMLKTR
ncbi:hypothetical protein C817_02134 [Dorea sp. 5-2]|nr:hypothetical protein C817_02134 [Dorea sp. 5-2]